MSIATTNESPKAEPLDTSVRLVTPERVEFSYPLAGPFRRSLAYLLDLVVIGTILLVGTIVAMILSLGTPSGIGVSMVLMFVMTWGYGAFCEGIFNGQTVGKKALGIRVVTMQGVPIVGSQAVLRNLIGVALDGPMLFFYLPGLTCMMLTSRFQRLGDLAAGTMVVVEQQSYGSKVARVEPQVIAGILPLLPLRVSAGTELARALSDYVRHRQRLPREHRERMAEHLARPLRERYMLPADTTADAVLCGFYHRLFVGE